jgi:hypothetical protein
LILGLVLVLVLREPARGQSEPDVDQASAGLKGGTRAALAEIFRHWMVPMLVVVFIGGNFVAMIFLRWPPSFLYRKFSMSLAMAGFSSTAYLQMASMLGVISGGILADRLAAQVTDEDLEKAQIEIA